MKKFIILMLSAILVLTNQSIDGTAIEVPDSNFVKESVRVVSMESLVELEKVNAIEELEVIKEEKVDNEKSGIYFDIPLDQDVQNHIFSLCEERKIDPAIIMAMIKRESNYTASIIGDNGNSYGLMQIQPKWHKDRMDSLNCPNLLNPYQNVTVGIDILGDLIESGNGIEWALMAYNGGASYANKKVAKGELSDYATTVLNTSKTLVRR